MLAVFSPHKFLRAETEICFSENNLANQQIMLFFNQKDQMVVMVSTSQTGTFDASPSHR